MEQKEELTEKAIEAVRRSGIELEIKELVMNNWPPARIFRFVRDQHRIQLSLSNIVLYAETVPTEGRLPLAGIEAALAEEVGTELPTEVRIDPLQEFAMTLRLQSRRVRTGLIVEGLASGNVKEQKRITGLVSQAMRDYTAMLKGYVEVAQSLGVLAKTPDELVHKVKPAEPTLGEMMQDERMGRSLVEAKTKELPPVREEHTIGDVVDSTARVVDKA